MVIPSPLNFANQNLRNRSFKGRHLIGADFSGSDIRGCDFSNAVLYGANFKQVKAGQTLVNLIALVIVAVAVIIPTFHAISLMLFGVLGLVPESTSWKYTLIFFISLGITAVSSGVRGIISSKSILGRMTSAVSAATSGALLAFFYRSKGLASGDPEIPIKAVIFTAVVMAIAPFYLTRGWLAVAISVAGSVAAYGFAFLVATVTFAYLSTQNFVWGLIWSVFLLGAIALFVISFLRTVKDITGSFATSFRGADLTNANFEGAKLGNTDFSGAVGFRS